MIEDIKKMFNLDCTKQELVQYIIIYLRKSRKDAEFSHEPLEKTLERHEKQLQDFSQKIFGIKIPEKNIFREVVSGDTISDRPQMQKVLDLIESDSIKAVLCVEIERLARGNSIDQGVIAQKFQITNTKIITPVKIYDLDNEFDLSFFEDGLYQSRKFLTYTKKILARGKLQSVKEGKFIGSKAPFGYDRKKLKNEKGWTLEKNEDNWIVRKIYDLFLYENMGATNIAHQMNILGVNGAISSTWSTAMIRSILKRNDVYAGYIAYNRRKEVKKYVDGNIVVTRPESNDYLLIKGLHEPTITEEEYEQVKRKLKEAYKPSTKKGYNIKNPLAGLIKCGLCGRSMYRRPYNKSFTKNGKINDDSLLCTNLVCNNVSSTLKFVEEAVLNEIKKKEIEVENLIKDYKSNNFTILQNNNKIIKEIDLYKKKISTLEKQKAKTCELLEKEIYTPEMFFERTNDIKKEIEEANNYINQLEKKQKNNEIAKLETMYPKFEKIINLYDNISVEDRNELLKSIIKEIRYFKINKNGRFNEKARRDFRLEIDWRF